MCGDAMDIVDGHPTGSVRISFGYMSTMKDARIFIDFITNTFLIPVSILFVDNIRKKTPQQVQQYNKCNTKG